MLEQLIGLVQQNAGDAIINNPAIPNEKNEEAIHATASGIMDTLKSQMSSGGIESITSLFSGNNTNMISQITQQVGGQLVQRFGLDTSSAGNIVSGMIPQIMQQFVHKTNDPNDSSFNMESIVGSLTGGGAEGIMNSVKGMFGGL